MKKKAPNKKQKAATEFTTALGYKEIQVRYKPAGAFDEEEIKELLKFSDLFGKTDSVRVRATRARDVQQYHGLLFGPDPEKLAEFLCRKEAGWGALLELDSLTQVMNLGKELNHDFWIAWFRQMMERNEAVMPGGADIVSRALKLAIERTEKNASHSAASSSASA